MPEFTLISNANNKLLDLKDIAIYLSIVRNCRVLKIINNKIELIEELNSKDSGDNSTGIIELD